MGDEGKVAQRLVLLEEALFSWGCVSLSPL